MVTLADFSDTASMMSCKRCGRLLGAEDRFCRFCGQDQLDDDPDAPAVMSGLIDVTQPPANGDALAQPGRRAEGVNAGDGALLGRTGGGFPGRWAVRVAAVVLVVLAIALLHDLYRGWQDENTRRVELGAALAQVEEALGRGDLNEAQLKLSILDALNPNDAEVKAKREAFEQRVQALTAERDRLRAVVAKEQADAGDDAAAGTPEAAVNAAPPVAAVAAVPEVPASPAASAATPTPATSPAPVSVPIPAPAPAPPPASAPAPAPTPAPAPVAESAPVQASVPASTPPPAPPSPSQAPAATSNAPPPAACPEALAALALCPKR